VGVGNLSGFVRIMWDDIILADTDTFYFAALIKDIFPFDRFS
jgi:hypothetical protein